MSYYNHLGFNEPDFYDNDTISIRKCDPAIAAYLKARYGDKLPADVEFWEKLPTPNDKRYWIDALSEQVMKDNAGEFGYGDPSVAQYHITDMDITEVIRRLGKLIDAKKQEIGERVNGRTAGTSQGLRDIAYLTGQMDGLRTAIKSLQGKDEFTVGESLNEVMDNETVHPL